MEKHFLDDLVEGAADFRPEPWYNPHGDCIIYQTVNDAVVANRVDEILTIYLSAVDNRPIGFQIKGVKALIQKFGWDGLSVKSEEMGGELREVSVAAILLAAYEVGPQTIGRRQGYASATFTRPPFEYDTISVNETCVM